MFAGKGICPCLANSYPLELIRHHCTDPLHVNTDNNNVSRGTRLSYSTIYKKCGDNYICLCNKWSIDFQWVALLQDGSHIIMLSVMANIPEPYCCLKVMTCFSNSIMAKWYRVWLGASARGHVTSQIADMHAVARLYMGALIFSYLQLRKIHVTKWMAAEFTDRCTDSHLVRQ